MVRSRSQKHPVAVACRKCGTTQNLATDHSNANGKRSLCRSCSAHASRAYRQQARKRNGSPIGPRSNSPTLEPLTDTQLVHQLRTLIAVRRPHPWELAELSDHFDVGVTRIRRALDALSDMRVNVRQSDTGGVWIAGEIPQRDPTVIPLASLRGQSYRFGLTADNHLCSKYARMDVLNALFDLWADLGVSTVLQCGNMIDGEARFNKGDLVAYGIQGQIEYFCEHWPQRKGMTTQFITGDDHEGWYIQREHVDIGQLIQDTAQRMGRTDLVYLGHMEHDITLQAPDGKATMRLIHAGGGSAYATSYAPQKLVESYTGGEKPQILLIGHYHKAEYGYPREVHTVQAAATQAQTPFMRKNKIQSHLGGWTLTFEQSKDGIIHGFTPRFDPFFDREFYEERQWKYMWRGRKAA